MLATRWRYRERVAQRSASGGPSSREASKSEVVGGGDDKLNQRERRLDQPVIRGRVSNDLVEHALIVGSSENLFTARNDVLTGKSLHRAPCSCPKIRRPVPAPPGVVGV